jgi:hypothetical protein
MTAFLPSPAHAQIVAYEALSYPWEEGWSYTSNYCGPSETLEEGWLVHHVDMCPGDPPPGGQQIGYTRSLVSLTGLDPLFFQFRLITDGPSTEFVGVAPAALSVWSQCGVNYQFVIAADKVMFVRDNLLPIPIVDIQPGVPHTYRLELYGVDLYIWYIDNWVADAGVPEGLYPCLNPAINFRTKANTVPNTTRWDYIRYGKIPAPHSGDFDSDGDVDEADLYLFVDCLLGSDSAGPGCTWGDMNADGTCDGQDIQAFVQAMLAP